MRSSDYMKSAIIAGMALLFCIRAGAQDSTAFSWWNPARNAFPVIEGQAWPNEVKSPYDRLPARAEKTVRDKVWYLAGQSAGLAVRFRTNAKEIVVRYTVAGKLEMPHMPATGVSGVDLYAIEPDGGWRWAAGKYKFSDTITYRYTAISDKAREFRLYLPLYNKVTWMEIGVPGNTPVTPLPVRKEKPIVVYGTSIAQGGCASRPGLAWTAQLDRLMDRQVINLGFSGNGKLEPAVTDLLTEIDARIYILDCLPNITGLPKNEVSERIITAVQTLRKKRPDVPILLTGYGSATQPLINTLANGTIDTVNQALFNAYQQLQASGTKQVYLLPAAQLNFDISATVDGVHPTDIGMQAYAKAYEKSLRTILQEPAGTINTTMPCRNYRELHFYDWDARHNEILSMNKKSPPRTVLLGNSITHYWGGLPKGPVARGADSWKEILDPAGARNMGFGWDRVENVLWRVYHDELDGYQAKKIVILIGTNNLQMNTDEEISTGLAQLAGAIRLRQPAAGIMLCGLLPRSGMEARIREINKHIMQVAGEQQVQYINPGEVLLKTDQTIDASLFTDGLHPNANGYRRLADFLKPYLQ